MEGIKVWVRAGTLILVVFITTVGGCLMHVDYRIAKAIEQGNDPVASRVAFETGSGHYERLLYLAIRGSKPNQAIDADTDHTAGPTGH